MKHPSLEQAKQLFTSEYASEELVNKNAENYLKALDFLGERWLLAKEIKRKELK